MRTHEAKTGHAQLDPRSDSAIRDALGDRLRGEAGLDVQHVEIVVADGRVLLNGVAEDDEARRRIEAVARETPGVAGVRNLLRVRAEIHAPHPDVEAWNLDTEPARRRS